MVLKNVATTKAEINIEEKPPIEYSSADPPFEKKLKLKRKALLISKFTRFEYPPRSIKYNVKRTINGSMADPKMFLKENLKASRNNKV